ncbi:MAG: hypothetical protein M1828_002930 [Chrysothrix sp. TS-e1954]|nr:MAG: hypothetical protein M1828_002930 [Chrysothrix sp. TS-e1954]
MATATAKISMTRLLIEEGMIVVRKNGFKMSCAMRTETEDGLKARGMTNDGGFIQICMDDKGATDRIKHLYVDDSLPRPGLGSSGPNTATEPFPNSFLQQYGGNQDLVALSSFYSGRSLKTTSIALSHP